MKINGNITLNALGQSQIENLFVERVSAIPAFNSADKGRMIFNLGDNTFYTNDGATWVSVATGGNAAALADEINNIETTLGSFVNADGTINASALEALNNVTGATTLMEALTQLDAAIAGKDSFAELLDVNMTGLVDGQFTQYNAATGNWEPATLVLTDISDVTATVTEVNYLSGVTSAVQTQIDNETAARVAADNTLQTNIDAETTRATTAESNIQAELDVTQVGVGLNTDGTYKGHTGTNYLDAVVDFQNADIALDTNLKALSDNHDAFVASQATRDTNQDTAIAEKLPLAGGTMTGNIVMSAGTAITVTDAPTLGTDATNKAYVDNVAAGLFWKAPARVATAASIANLSGDTQDNGDNTYLIDGVAVATGDRVLVKDGASPDGVAAVSNVYNGIYEVTVAAGTGTAEVATFTRTVDADAISELTSSAIFVSEGAVSADVGYVCTTDAGAVLGTDTIDYVQFNGAANIIAGIGLAKVGNQIDVNLGAGIAELPTDEVGLDVLATGGIFTTLDGTTSSTATGAQAAIKIDTTDATFGATISTSVDGIRVAQTVVDKINTIELNLGTETTNRQTADTNLQNELDATQVGAGLDVTGAYITNLAANYIFESISLYQADAALDTALKNEETNRQAADTTLQTNIDTEATTRAAADSALGTRIDNGYFLYENLTPATSHVVAHNIGSQFCNVTVIDATTNEQVIPQSVVFDTTGQLTVTFNSALACRVVVMGLAV